MLLPKQLPISYLRGSGSADPPHGLIVFLGAISGSYWYAVFRSPLRPTSRDKMYCTHGAEGCQRVFGRLLRFLMYGVKKALDGSVEATNGVWGLSGGWTAASVVPDDSSP
jgi:hypothetical protein